LQLNANCLRLYRFGGLGLLLRILFQPILHKFLLAEDVHEQIAFDVKWHASFSVYSLLLLAQDLDAY